MRPSLWLVALVQGWLLPAVLQAPVGEVGASQGSASVPPRCRSGIALANGVVDYFLGVGVKAGHCCDGEGGMKESDSSCGV